MYKLNGKALPMDVAFTHNDVQYPANWLRLSTKEEKDALGIEEVVHHPRPDDKYFYVSQNEDGTWNAIPKPQEVLDQIRRDEIISQIEQLERDAMLNRGSREIELVIMREKAQEFADANGVPLEAVLERNPYYNKVKDLDDLINALREHL